MNSDKGSKMTNSNDVTKLVTENWIEQYKDTVIRSTRYIIPDEYLEEFKRLINEMKPSAEQVIAKETKFYRARMNPTNFVKDDVFESSRGCKMQGKKMDCSKKTVRR